VVVTRCAARLLAFLAPGAVGAGLLVGSGCAVEPVIAQRVELAAFPATTNVGDVPLLATDDTAVVVANQGNAVWVPTRPPQVDGAGWTWIAGCDTPLAPGATCTAQLRFAPEAIGPAPGSFTVPSVDDEPVDRGATVALVGVGVPAQLELAPAALDFGDVVVGRSATRTATVTNLGAELLRVPLGTTAPFLVDGTGGEHVVELGPGASADVVVVFGRCAPPSAAATVAPPSPSPGGRRRHASTSPPASSTSAQSPPAAKAAAPCSSPTSATDR
jgi:hypothetical protein